MLANINTNANKSNVSTSSFNVTHNPYHYSIEMTHAERFNSTQPRNQHSTHNVNHNHKRSNTMFYLQQAKEFQEEQVYTQQLFEQHEELFQHNNVNQHHQQQQNQPKVVRLSLTNALANNMHNKKSRDSLKSYHNDKKSMGKDVSQVKLHKNNSLKDPIPYSHGQVEQQKIKLVK